MFAKILRSFRWGLVLPLLLHLAPNLSAAPQKDALGKAFSHWIKAFQAGRLNPEERGFYPRKSLLPSALMRGFRNVWMTRGEEARELFGLLARRGRIEDGQRLIRVIKVSLKLRKKAGAWGRRFRLAASESLKGMGSNPGIQTAVADRVEKGLSFRADKKAPGGKVWTHKEAKLAGALLPILGSFRNPVHRTILERCLKVKSLELRLGAAEGLAGLGSGKSVARVAGILGELNDPYDLRRVANAILSMIKGKRPPAEERDLRRALTLVIDRLDSLKDWRGRISLIPILGAIRSQASVPFLIGLMQRSKKASPQEFSGTLKNKIHEILMDLTGYFAPVNQVDKWVSWWKANKETFHLAPVRDLDKSKGWTSGKGFFGIPITGSRVVFILDISGSMQAPLEGGTVARGRDGKVSRGGETRMDRAKSELRGAVKGLPVDSKFNVIFFSGGTKKWRKHLVQATQKNKKALFSYLLKINPNGGTALYDGMKEGLKVKELRKRGDRYSSSVDEIFLLSDGMPSVGEILDPEEILIRIREWNLGANVRINTIFVGSTRRGRRMMPPGVRGMGPDKFMGRMAKENGGVFKKVGR